MIPISSGNDPTKDKLQLKILSSGSCSHGISQTSTNVSITCLIETAMENSMIIPMPDPLLPEFSLLL